MKQSVKMGIALGVLLMLAPPVYAAKWAEIGNKDNSTDKVYVDTESLQQADNYTIAQVMTVYEIPRVNTHNITLDRHIQKTAFDCVRKTFSPIQTIGYLNGKQIATSPENTDWKNRFVPVKSDPFSQRVLTAVCSSTSAAKKNSISSASGIVVNADGYVLTNNHAIKNCSALMVKVVGYEPQLARVEAVDPKNDLALLKTKTGIGEPVHFRSQSQPAKIGESIGIIGYPFTGLLSSEPKATFGQINSVAGLNNDYTLLQISAPIQPGNSGGPVFDSSGSVVGVVVSTASPLVFASLTGALPQNINFAIRGEIAQIFLTAHGVSFSTSDHQRKLETEEIAANGQKSTVFLVCMHTVDAAPPAGAQAHP